MKVHSLLLLAVVLALLSACGTSAEDQRATQTAAIAASETRKADHFATQTAAPTATSVPTSTPATYLTLDGYDKDAGIIVTPINLWKDYNDRSAGIAAKGQHGERVKLIRRSGDGVQIELQSGEKGWVTYYFIKEYK
jgi:ABC-type Fe3+-hydroxamate transport system substrate-binding protein